MSEKIVPEVLDYRVEIPLGSMTDNEQTKFWLVEGRLREKNVRFDTGFSFNTLSFERKDSGVIREWCLDWSLEGMAPDEIIDTLKRHDIPFEVEITVRD